MILFLIKKNFCDGWDNLLSIVITNIVFLLCAIGLYYLAAALSVTDNFFVMAAVLIVSSIVLSTLTFAYGDTAAMIAGFNGIRITDYFKAIPGVLKDATLFALLVDAIVVVSYLGISFYWGEAFLAKAGLMGIFLGALIVWLDFIVLLSLMWFIPIRSLMHDGFKKCLKKSFIIFFDNTDFTLSMFLYNIILLALSVVLVGVAPSMAGILLANTNALRLRLYKYDYLEAHPELKTKKERRKIPWAELIYDDQQTLGPRKFKSFIFPWRE